MQRSAKWFVWPSEWVFLLYPSKFSLRKWWSCCSIIHDSILAASRCACWKTALGVVWPVARGCEMAWFFTWLSELCVTQSVVEPKLQCPLEWKLLCKRISKTGIWSACAKFNLGKSTRCPHLWMSTFYHCFSAEGEGRCSAFLLETCYYALVKVFSILDIVFWRRVSQLWLCKGFWVLHPGALEMRSEWLCSAAFWLPFPSNLWGL